MKEFLRRVETSLKCFLKDKTNVIIAICLIGFTGMGAMQNYQFKKISVQVDGIKKKVDHRYFNLTSSLQDIHSVEIETLHGRVQRHFEVKK